MSNYAGELWVKIRADMAQLRTGLSTAKQEIKTFSGQVAASSAGLKKFGISVTLVSGALALLQGLAVKTFATFEQSLANTFSVLNAYGDEIQQITDYTRKMGETTIFTASEAADAMYYLASAGFDAQKSMSALKGTLDLAAATQFDLAETTRLVVTAMNAFGLSGSEASRVANTFSAIISSSQATMERLGDSFKYVAPIAAALGIDLEQTAAALGKLYNSGLAASQAGTYLRQGLIRLQKPTKEMKDGMAALGIKVGELNPQTNDLIDIISALERASAGATDAGDEMAKIFGVRASTAFQILVREGATALSVMESKITGTSKASSMAKIQINTLKGSMKLLKSTIQETAIQIGEKLAPTIRIVAESVRNLFKGFNSLPAPMKSFIINSMGIVTVLGLIVGPLTLLLSFLPKIITGIQAIGLAMSTTSGVIGLVAIAITALISVMGSYANQQEKIRNRINNTMNSLNETTDSMIKQKEKQYDLIKSYIELGSKLNKTEKQIDQQKQKFEQIKALYPDLIDSTDTYTSAVKKMGDIADDAATELKSLYEQKRKLRELELVIDTAKAQKAMRDLKKEMIDTSLGVFQAIGAGFGLLGDTAGVELEMAKEKMDELASSSKGLELLERNARLMASGLHASSTMVAELSAELEKLEAISEGELWAVDKKRMETLKEQLLTIYGQQAATERYIDVYTQSIQKGKELLGYEVKIKENQIELNNLKAKQVGEGEDEDGVVPDRPDMTLAENQKKINTLLYELRQQSIDSQLALFEHGKKKELDIALRYNDLQTASEVEQFKHERNIAIASAKESGVDVEKVKSSYADRAEALQADHERRVQAVKEFFVNKEIDLELNKLSLMRGLTVEELESFKDMLTGKLSQVETWGDAYVGILKKIKQIQDDIFQHEENKIKFDLEVAGQEDVFGDVDEEAYIEQLERYKEYLEKRKQAEVEYSKEWMDLQREINDVTQQMYDANLEYIKEKHGFVIDGLMSGFDHMWDTYIIGARKAKNEMDAVWLSIKNTTLRAIQDIVNAEVTKLLYKLLFKIAGLIMGGGVGAVVSTVGGAVAGGGGYGSYGTPDLTNNAVGARVKRSGVAKVHQNEVIVPAEVVRQNRKDYEKDYGTRGGNNITEQSPQPSNMTFILNNPTVDDSRYWDDVFNKHVRSAEKEFKKRS